MHKRGQEGVVRTTGHGTQNYALTHSTLRIPRFGPSTHQRPILSSQVQTVTVLFGSTQSSKHIHRLLV